MGLFTDLLEKTKVSLQNAPVPKLGNTKFVPAPSIVIPKKVAPMEFRVGEGLTPEQAKIAHETVRKVDPIATKKPYSFKESLALFKSNIASQTQPKFNQQYKPSPEETKAAFTSIINPTFGSTSGLVKGFTQRATPELLEFLAKTKSPQVIESEIIKLGIAPDVAKSYAPRLAATKNVDEVKNVLFNETSIVPKKTPVPGESPAQALARSEAYAKAQHPNLSNLSFSDLKSLQDKTYKELPSSSGNPKLYNNILNELKNRPEYATDYKSEISAKTESLVKPKITTDIQGNQVEQQFIRPATKLEQTSPTAKSKGYQNLPDKEGFQKVFKPYGEQGAGYYYNKVLPTPAQLQSQIDLTKELLAEHPGTKLNKLIPDKVLKTNYLDKTTGANLSLRTLKANAKKDILNKKLQGVFEGTPQSDSFDNYDVIEKAKEDAKALKERLKVLQQQKISLKNDIHTGKPIRLTAQEQAMVGTGKRSVPFMPKTSQPPSPKPRQLDTTTGEGRSIEMQGRQAREVNNIEKPPTNDLDDSLIDTISKEPTPVKNKVNIVDYIRTPDRVLKKIGLEEEGKYLRSQHDKYLKELPKNIDKITAWSKRTSPSGNEDIFRYLDGEAVELKPQDKAVATEIQAYLKQWADRLGLPKDNRIQYYITHIFDQELIAKEFPEELAKLIDNKIPGEVYDPFLEKRLGALGYRKDTWKALDAYVKRATRKVHMDPALEKIKDASGKLEKSQYDYVKTYVNNINMRPNKLDTLIDNGIKQVIGYKFGQRPLLTMTKFLRQMTYRVMLGLNPASALKNISQGINTYSKLGEKYTTIGYAKLFSKGSKTELEAEGILNGGFIEDRALSSTKKAIEKLDKGLFIFFETAEHINRGAAYFGAKAQGLSKGMGEREAIDYAKKIVRDTQFVFGKIDTPLVLASDLGKTIGQFQSFTTKQIEFLLEMGKRAAKGDEKAKNFIGLLRYAVAGVVFVYTVGQAFNMKITDLIPGIRLGTPPSLKLPTEIIKAGINTPDKYGQERDFGDKAKDIGNAALGLIPGGIQGKKTYQGYQALQEGVSKDAAGRAQYDVGGTPFKNAQALIFGKYSGQGAQDYYENDTTYAEATLKKIQNLGKEKGKEELAKIIKENPALWEGIQKVLTKQARGITEEDEKLLNMGVATKQRAKEVAKRLNKLDNVEEKKALMAEYLKKKIITLDVAKQLAEFIEK